MTEKTKKMILISIGCLLCAAVAIGIAARFGGKAEIPSGVVSDEPAQSGDPDVSINSDGQTDVDIQVEVPDASETDPAQGADSSGLEQTIQADPVKPEQPEKPEAPDGTSTLPENHDAEDVPEEKRRTEDEEPPTGIGGGGSQGQGPTGSQAGGSIGGNYGFRPDHRFYFFENILPELQTGTFSFGVNLTL